MKIHLLRKLRIGRWLILAAFAAPTMVPALTAQVVDDDEDILELSPFEVTEGLDQGYYAPNTLAGSRLSTPLIDVPSPISVMNRQFLDDIAATSVNEALEYGLNTINAIESFTGNDHAENNFNFRMRGISGAQRSRNYLRSDLNSDSFNIERLDFSRGPNSILFGEGSPAGMINTTTKFARLGRNFSSVQGRIGSFNQKRATIDTNRAVGENFAVRANLLWEEGDGYREFEFKNKLGFALAATWRPFTNTRIRAEGEYIDSKENRARPWTGYDLYSFWVANGRPGGGSPTQWGDTTTGMGSFTGGGSVQYFNNGPLGGVAFLGQGSSGANSYFRQSLGMSVIPGMNTPSNTLDFSVVPRNSNLYGAFNRSDSVAEIGSIYLEQRIGEDFIFELAGGIQREDRMVATSMGFARNEVRFDANAYIPQFNANGVQTGIIPNPNFGHMVVGDRASHSFATRNRYETRATASYHLQSENLLHDRGFWTQLLGHHRLAVLGSKQRLDLVRIANRETNIHPDRFNPDLMHGSNAIVRFTYIDPFGHNTWNRGAADPGWHPINDRALAGNATSAPLVDGVRVTSGWVQNNHRRDRTDLTTRMFVMQNYFWNDRVVGLFGWRRDSVDSYSSSLVIDPMTQERVDSIMSTSPDRTDKGRTNTRGVVVHVIPRLISVYYNESDNFTPQTIDELFSEEGDFRPVGNRIGDGKDAGVKLMLFDGKVYASLGWYKTADDNQRTSVDGNYRNLVNGIWDRISLANPSVPYREVSGGDTRTLESKGYELDLTANLLPNWRMSFNYKNADTESTKLMNNVAGYIAANRALWMQHANVEYDEGSLTRPTVGAVVAELEQRIQIDRAAEGQSPYQDRRITAAFTTNYNFVGDGYLNGLGVGGGVQYRGKSLIGYRTFTDGSPVFAPDFYMTNAWVQYGGRMTDNIDYRIQFNVDNLLNHQRPQPIQSGQPNPANPGRHPDLTDTGGLAWNVTLPVPRRYSVTATFSF